MVVKRRFKLVSAKGGKIGQSYKQDAEPLPSCRESFGIAKVRQNNEKERMPNTSPSGNQTGVPEGYLAIPMQESELGASIRLCVLARQTPDPVAGHLVLLRDLPDAMVYLGCLLDAGGRLREWTELWVQNVDGLESSLPALRESFSNHSLDQRWAITAKSFAALNPRGFIQTGWETKHPLPTFLDLSRQQPVHPGPADN